MERLFRRCRLPLGLSQGFHPKPRMTFPLALALGIAGEDEVMELELAETLSAEQVQAAAGVRAPPGLQFRSVEVLAEGTHKARVRSTSYQVPIPVAWQIGLGPRVAGLLAAAACPVRRPAGARRRSTSVRAWKTSLFARAGSRCASATGLARLPDRVTCWRPWA